MLYFQVLLLNHVSGNLSLAARIQLLTAFAPVARCLSHISVELPDLFTAVVSLFVLYTCVWLMYLLF